MAEEVPIPGPTEPRAASEGAPPSPRTSQTLGRPPKEPCQHCGEIHHRRYCHRWWQEYHKNNPHLRQREAERRRERYRKRKLELVAAAVIPGKQFRKHPKRRKQR